MDVVDTPKKEIRDMNVMELIKSVENGQRTHKHVDECAQKMKDIRLLADKSKLQDAIDNIGIAFRIMEMLTEINDTKVTNKNVKDIVLEMLESDDEELTSVSDDSD